MHRVLIVDDEPEVLAALKDLLSPEGYAVTTAEDPAAALALFLADPHDLAILDVWMPGTTGLEMCQRIKALSPRTPVIIMTGKDSADVAIKSSKFGAFCYQPKPFEPEEMLRAVREALEKAPEDGLGAGPQREEDSGESLLVGKSPAMQKVYRAIGRVAPTDTTVLIRGESGTGKELVARAIWRHSSRGDKPLVTLSCAAIPETLLESELFGHERGAFTGAEGRRVGKFELADRGTILLDEIGETPLAIQVKILRLLQEMTFERIGGNNTLRVDVRILASTNRDLEAAIHSGRLREDLYYRLHVVTIWVPPLRDRKEDIVPLVQHCFSLLSREFHCPAPVISKDALRVLSDYNWPGNVRQLRHCIRSVFLLRSGSSIRAEDVRQSLRGDSSGSSAVETGADYTLTDFVRRYLAEHQGEGTQEALLDKVNRMALIEALLRVDGNQTRAAEWLGIPRPTLHAKMKKYGIHVGRRIEEEGASAD